MEQDEVQDEGKSVDTAAADPAPAIRTVELTMERLFAAADVRRVFGEPIQQGETVLVPAAESLTAAGFGLGMGGGVDSKRGDRGGGGGGGGGGKTLTRAVAVIVASPDGVRVEPVIDYTKIALAALTAAGFMAATFFGMRKQWLAAQRQSEP